MLKEDQKAFKDAVQLYLITLPTVRRRHLHVLLNYLKRIAENATLKLAPEGNKCMLLECLSPYIVRPGGSISTVQSLRLVSFLMDHVVDLFKVPDCVPRSLEQQATLKQRRSTGNLASASLRYCSSVTPSEQSKVQEEALLGLLDGIIKDENLPPDTRKRHLKEVGSNESYVIANLLF
ncbi:DEP domain containing 1-like protein [Aphelenchoides avenae]|nr:DEP domain containing 1-like protein [Aphelenchus avenae]